MRKAQVTLFIIIGIFVILSLIAVIFVLRPGEKEQQISNVPLEAQPVKNYIDSCLEKTAQKAVQLIGLQGGYLEPPEQSLKTNYSRIPYYYYNGNASVPKKEFIESQIALYIPNAIGTCFDNFSVFKAQGYSIMVKESAAEVIARENDIYVKLNYPVKISKGSTDIEISEYTATIPVRLDYIYEVSRQVVAKTMADPEWVDMAFLSGFDAKVDIIPNDNSSFIYSITDQRSRAGDASFVFLFANKFIVNQPPVMTVPDILKFQEGKPSLYKVNATDPEKDVLVFSDDSSLFDISEKGVILFTPEVPGMYDVTLTVEDTHRNKVSRLVKFRIE